MKTQITRDPEGKERLERGGTPIAMSWERPYIEACIDALQPSGDVLEVGYGLGYGAARIRTYHPRSHTVIEAIPEIAAQARQAGVNVIEESWEKALTKLGSFDVVFFHDYASKHLPKEPSKKAAGLLVKAGKALVESAMKKFSLKSMRYSDEDLAAFLQMMEKSGRDDSRMVLRFFADLYKDNQITLHQWENLAKELVKRGWALPEEIAKAEEAIVPAVAQHDSRVLEFLETCLDRHMKKGARFSCFLDDPASKYEDPVFMEQVINNPALDYAEKWIEVEPPAHCPYYREKSALVITITKA